VWALSQHRIDLIDHDVEVSSCRDLDLGLREKYKLLLIKNYDRSDISLSLPANKLACLSFINVGRRHGATRQERKDFITGNDIISQDVSIPASLSPNSCIPEPEFLQGQ